MSPNCNTVPEEVATFFTDDAADDSTSRPFFKDENIGRSVV